jgi:NADH-quinone oxidoreductase subunit E
MTIQKILLSFRPKKENLLPLLHQVNSCFGYISKEDTYRIADYFGIMPAKIYGIITASGNLNYRKPSRVEIAVCSGQNCKLKGSAEILREIENYLSVKADRQPTEEINLRTISGGGHCLMGPTLIVNGNFYENVKPFEVDDILKNYF